MITQRHARLLGKGHWPRHHLASYVDQPVTIRIPGGGVWQPGDVSPPSYAPMTLRSGLVYSKNTITAIRPTTKARTPIAMANFMQIMADAGLPEGVVNVVYGAGDAGELGRRVGAAGLVDVLDSALNFRLIGSLLPAHFDL